MSESNKEIVYFIFATGAANGGHYRSLALTAEHMSKTRPVRIIVFGYTYSHIIKNCKVESKFVYFNGLNVFQALKKSMSIIQDSDVILHAFDHYAYFLVRILGEKLNLKTSMTKCGGPNPSSYFPQVSNLVLFSKENFDYFQNNSKFLNSQKVIIPNRTEYFESNYSKIEEIRKQYNLNKEHRIILRICRISKDYKISIQQSIQLFQFVKKIDPNFRLIVLGNIQNHDVYSELSAGIGQDVIWITEDKYTKNAKEMIDIAHWVVGTGRGFMEAAAKNKILFVVNQSSYLPTLITENNFSVAFEYNFSQRIKFDEAIVNINQSNIESIIKSELQEEFKSISFEWYTKYFSIEEGVKKYNSFYDNLKTDKLSKFDIIKHWLFFIKNNLGTWYRLLTR